MKTMDQGKGNRIEKTDIYKFKWGCQNRIP